ncbi:hypothetical protein F2Q70_00043254 [Brassica cretica]|uniref:Uncharacterized protein n=1 Tax=Brassica cretica TaxID=69181 RepID=A0A8S9KD98_BRACR|nr:hypothetical protein F2Q70_00043254 [Brassica cretica]
MSKDGATRIIGLKITIHFYAHPKIGTHESQRLADSPRRKEGPEKRTISKEILNFIHVFGEWEKRVDAGTDIRLAPKNGMQFSSTDAAFIRTKKKNFVHELELEISPLITVIYFRGTNQ